jgi:6-pyruvoyltetrahydropterin/6-carboxytetrahydropterin synthase
MYTVAVRSSFKAKHQLFTHDGTHLGPEHGHDYMIEVRVSGTTLDADGFLVNIDHLRAVLQKFCARFNDANLNTLREFEDMNTSVEHFVKAAAFFVREHLPSVAALGLHVRMWEDPQTWASWTMS